MVEEYRKLVDADEAGKYAEKQFNATCKHYIAHLSKKEAIEKISESYKIMKDYLPTDISISNSFYYVSLKSFNRSDDLEKVYDFFLASITISKGSYLKDFIRILAIRVKTFWYYYKSE